MNGYINNKKDRILLTFLTAFAYFCSYMTRVNYKAVLTAVMESENLTKDAASVALTGLFITYGLGQLLSGWLGDKINPKYLMCAGLLLAAAMNCLMPLCDSVAMMTLVWCINGVGQAFMWPPIVKTLTNFLNPDDYLHASVKVSWGSAFATILLYLVCPLIIEVSGGWKPVFYICALIGALGAVFVFTAVTGLEKKYPGAGKECHVKAEIKENEAPKPAMPKKIYGYFGILLLCIIVQGALRDGVDAWMPSYIKDTFDLGSSISILTGVVLPIFTIISYQVATFVYEKFIKNEMTCGAFFFILSSLFSALLFASRSFSGNGGFNFMTCVSILLFALIVGCMHAINLLFTCFVPRRFRKYGNISWVSGLTNFATYVGSAASTYGFAVLTEDFGWNGTITFWVVLGLAGAAFCFWGFFPWKKFLRTEKQA